MQPEDIRSLHSTAQAFLLFKQQCAHGYSLMKGIPALPCPVFLLYTGCQCMDAALSSIRYTANRRLMSACPQDSSFQSLSCSFRGQRAFE